MTETANLPRRSVFRVRAHAHSQLLLRITGLFAQLDLVPTRLSCCTRDGCLLVAIIVEMGDPLAAERILQKMRALVGVVQADQR